MESSFSFSTSHTHGYTYTPSKPLFTAPGKRHSTAAKPPTRLLFSLNPPRKPNNNNESSSTSLRRPTTTTANTTPSKITKEPSTNPLQHHLTITDTPKTSSNTTPTEITKTPSNPLKNLRNSPPQPPPPTNSNTLTNKLWLTSKLSPPPPPPPLPPPIEDIERETATETNAPDSGDPETTTPRPEFREEGKIFVGNLPNWIKKHELTEFFRQFGPIKDVVLIKGHDDTERNLGYGFVMYGGSMADRSAMKAVEFDGVEFHGRVLTVKLDDGRRLKERSEKRGRWVEGFDGEEYWNQWHEEREGSRNVFRRVLETNPENWQAVVSAFERIPKVMDIAC